MTNGVDEIPPDIVAGIEECLGDRVQHGPMYVVRVEGKQQRLDPKIMVLSPHRAFLMAQKPNTKIDAEFNYLEIHTLESTKSLQLQFFLAYPSNKVIKMTTVKQEDTRAIIEHILSSLKKTFPMTSIDKMIPKISINPPDRSTSIHNTVDRMTMVEQGPCGGFTQMYACMCDLHGETYQAEVAWDVDTIYLSQDSKELCLNDFDHLEGKDLVPIVASLMYNSWFTKLTATNVKLNADTCKEIKKVMTKSATIEHLVLDNVGIKGDFAKELNTALIANPNTALRHIDLSNNVLEDRGVRHLAGEITKLPNGLVTLRLAKTGMTAESTVQLGKALLENNFMPTSLIKLDLSGNQFKDGDINNLTQFLATPNAITHLNLSDTEVPLDNLFNALYRGCCANLSHLNLSRNTFTYRKNAVVPQAFKQYFATSTGLKVLNLSYNKLPPDVVKEVILGIGSNGNLKDIELDLSGNELRMAGGRVVESCIANVPNITKLNLSDNDLNTSMASLLDWISQNRVIASLDIGQNLAALRPGSKSMAKVIDAIVMFIQNEETPLKTLSVAGNKLKFETIQIINALGSNTTLTSVDLSGNGMGDIGARMLAKALMINTKLHTVALDSNGITAKGFMDIADALERNYTLKYMPTPVNDVAGALKSDSVKTQEALQKIQTLLQRNHSPHKFSDDQAFRLQQGFLYTTSHQLVDQLVVQIQDTSKELLDCSEDSVQTDINTAKDIISDADNSKQLLSRLHQVALDSEDSEMMNKLEEIVTHVQEAACRRLEDNVSGMLEGATEQCSHMMKDPELKTEIETSCQEKKQLPDRFLQDVMEQVSAAIFNRISEANLAVASIISDTIIDEIIEQLTEYQEKLATHAQQYGKGRSSFCNTLASRKPSDITINGEKEEKEEDKKNKEGEEEPPKPKKKHKKSKKKTREKEEEDIDGPSVNYVQAKSGGRKVRRNPTMRMVQDKRRSVKVRPRSSVVKHEYRTALAPEDTEMPINKITETEEPAQNNSHSPSEPDEPVDKPAESRDATDGAFFSTPAKPIEPPASPSKKKKDKGPQLDVKAFNELSAASTTRLQDPRKTRPRRPGTQRPTRMGITPQHENNPGELKEEEKVDAGIDAFYKSEAAVPQLSLGKGSFSESSNSLDTPKDEKGSSIGGRIGGLFKKKVKTPKPEKNKSVKDREEKPKPPKEEKPKPAKKNKKGLFGRSKKSATPDDIKPEEDAKGKEPFQDPNQRAAQQAIEEQRPYVIPDIKDKQESTSEDDPAMSSSGDDLDRDTEVTDKDTVKSEERKREEDQVESVEVTSKPEEPEEQRKPSYKPPGARGLPGMGMPGMGGGNILADLKKKQEQRRASNNKTQELETVSTPPEVKETEKIEDKDEKEVKNTVEEETEKEKEENKEEEVEKEESKEEEEEKEKEKEKDEKQEEDSTETVETTKEADPQEKRVPLKLTLNMPSDEEKAASLKKPPSPRVSPKPIRSPIKPLPSPTKPPPSPTKPTPSPKSSPRTSGIFLPEKRASVEIAKAETEEKGKEEDKKTDTQEDEIKKEEPEPSKDVEKTQEDQESPPPVQLRKPRTPTSSEKRKSIPIPDPEKRKSNQPLTAEKRKSIPIPDPTAEKRKSIPTPDPEKRKSNPLPVMEKRKSGTPVGANKLIVPPAKTEDKTEIETPEKAVRNSLHVEDDKSPEVKSNGEQPTPAPRPAARHAPGGGPSPKPKPKPVPKPRPPSGVPPPSVPPRPKGRKSRDGPAGFSPTSSVKSPISPPGVNKPRSQSLDPNMILNIAKQKSENNAKDEDTTPMNGDAKKDSINSIEEDEEDPITKL